MHAFPATCALLLLAAALPGHAQQDPLKSPACGAALGSLEAARQGQAGAARVEALRSQAATTCLGMAAPPSRPSRVLQAPIAVPPPQIEPAPVAPPSLPALASPPPPVAVQRLPLPSTCEANGCWVDDGTHMRQVPPTLTPLCTQQGGTTYCP